MRHSYYTFKFGHSSKGTCNKFLQSCTLGYEPQKHYLACKKNFNNKNRTQKWPLNFYHPCTMFIFFLPCYMSTAYWVCEWPSGNTAHLNKSKLILYTKKNGMRYLQLSRCTQWIINWFIHSYGCHNMHTVTKLKIKDSDKMFKSHSLLNDVKLTQLLYYLFKECFAQA